MYPFSLSLFSPTSSFPSISSFPSFLSFPFPFSLLPSPLLVLLIQQRSFPATGTTTSIFKCHVVNSTNLMSYLSQSIQCVSLFAPPSSLSSCARHQVGNVSDEKKKRMHMTQKKENTRPNLAYFMSFMHTLALSLLLLCSRPSVLLSLLCTLLSLLLIPFCALSSC